MVRKVFLEIIVLGREDYETSCHKVNPLGSQSALCSVERLPKLYLILS